ncbi:hypothetical protein [Klebsiella variicola]|uniref:hypothetical protein n=1 Tax=Klebsiella variicola TaxID=244366 RepID=UPI001FA71162|nr:hypothetical protein [Klebsiella variicola]MCI4403525.1 hypothetical protein [Klebsiella variicola]
MKTTTQSGQAWRGYERAEDGKTDQDLTFGIFFLQLSIALSLVYYEVTDFLEDNK